MIKVIPKPEPPRFDANVRKPGLRAIAELVGEAPLRPKGKRFKKIAATREQIPSAKFPAYWTRALPDLKEAFQNICAYSCFRIHEVTGAASVDHMAPKSRRWDDVYEWSNYRLCCARLNAAKSDFGDVLDPFEVEDGWFILELTAFQVKPNDDLPESQREQIEATISRLGLNEFCKSREEDAERYWNREIALKTLIRESPFVAMELRRQGRLNKGDT